MIQFNLLPDVKIEFIKTRRRKRLLIFISAIASGASFAIFVLLFLFVRVNQPAHLKDLDKDIQTNVKKIQSTEDLDKILTIQNQLEQLPNLHDKKVVSSRMVDYLTQLTPNQATISDVTVDFTTNTMKIEGNADALITINKFVDTLKFTDYVVNNDSSETNKAFKEVVLQSFSVANPGQTSTSAISYELSFNFEPIIFQRIPDAKNTEEAVKLNVPKIISTRSATEAPNSLFAPQPAAPTPAAPGTQGVQR